VGLPLTFAGQFHSASMYLTAAQLVPLYATEWFLLGVLGIVLSVFAIGLNAVVRRFTLRFGDNAASNAAFASALALATILATQVWVESLGFGSRSQNGWHAFEFAALVLVGIVAGCGAYRDGLNRLATLARPIALLGAMSLLPMNSYRNVAHTAHSPTISTSALHPNIVLISLDALAAEHLIPYGAGRETSPSIAKFASDSIVFERFHATGNFTTPAVASMLTGVLPWTHRAVQLLGTPIARYVQDSLPARLRNAGYVTSYFATNPWAGPRRQGFSEYFDFQSSIPEWDIVPCIESLSDRLPYLCAASSNPLIGLPFKLAARVAHDLRILESDKFADPEQTVAAATAWTAARREAPVFMWVHFMQPHDPYAAPPPWLNGFDPSPVATTVAESHPRFLFESALDSEARIRTLAARYDESIKYVDHYVGLLISALRANLGANTAILLTADHGESFSHEYGGHGGLMLYEELLHIPLIVSVPDASTHGTRRSELSNQADLAPTIAAIAHIPASPLWEGVSLIDKPNDVDDRTLYAMSFEQNGSRSRLANGAVVALQHNWKLVRFLGTSRYPNMPPLQTQLFDTANDPLELRNVAGEQTDTLNILSGRIDEQLARAGAAVSE
jgi:arylsulfatase A-like enzyme